MAVFNTNQVHQFYVADAYSATVTEESNKATIGGVKVIDNGIEKELYFLYKGANTLLKSDLIQAKNMNYMKLIDAADMVIPMKSVKVVLDSNVNGGAVVAGQDYVLRIAFRQFFGMSDQDQYFKDVAVHATSAMASSAQTFYTALKDALDLAFSREVGATKTANPYLTFAASANGLTITEKPQDWVRGTMAQERVYFDVYPTTVYVQNDDVIWGVVTDQTPAKASATVGTNAIGNGKQIADLEYFCMGERGDQYRMIGWPNHIPTEYLVDPEGQYHVLEIHYGFTDTGVNSYRTEKDITIVSKTKSVLENIKSAVEAALGISSGDDGGGNDENP